MAVLQGKSLSASFKKSQTKPNLKHNRREGAYPENAIESRQSFNNHLLRGEPRQVYKEIFGEALDEYNAKQKRKDRKIDDYYSHIYNTDGKQKPYEEFIIGLGSREDWESATDDELREGVEVVSEMVEAFRQKNPSMHFVNVDVHGDESHPHAHVIAVPVGQGYKRGLSKQVSFSKALENQGYDRQDFIGWRDDQMDVFEGVLGSHGISRKHVGTNGYRDQEDYKQAKDEIKDYENNVLTGLERSNAQLDNREERLKEREEEANKKLEKADEKLKDAEKKLDEVKEVQGETYKMVERFRAMFNNLELPDIVKKGLSRYLETGKSGLAVGKEPNKKPATVEDLMKVVKQSNSDKSIKRAIKQAEEAEVEDDGPDL